MIKIGLCDDEKHVLESLFNILSKTIAITDFDARVEVMSQNQEVILGSIKQKEIDVLFLDIEFSKEDENGIKFAKKLRALNKDFRLVFLTGHYEYSMLAFKCKTFDYLLKPFTKNSLVSLLKRLKEDFEEDESDFIKISSEFIINSHDILFIERNKSKSRIYTLSNIYETSFSLKDLLSKLPICFSRIHRSYIVNEANIKSINKKSKIILFSNGISCPMGNFTCTNTNIC